MREICDGLNEFYAAVKDVAEGERMFCYDVRAKMAARLFVRGMEALADA